jgi:abnormal spindle-like microcephaly-associated protein
VARLREARRREAAATALQAWARGHIARRRYLQQRCAAVAVQGRWRAVLQGRLARRSFLQLRATVVVVQSQWRGALARRNFCRQRAATVTLQAAVRGWLARRWLARRAAALVALQRAVRRMAEARRERTRFLAVRAAVAGLQTRARGALARGAHRRLQEDQEYREQLRREEAVREAVRRDAAARVVASAVRTLAARRGYLRLRAAATSLQAAWRGRKGRVALQARWRLIASRYRHLQEIKARLEEATVAARPEQRLGARTHSAISYIFNIRDVAQLISAVKTLELSTRLSLDCCLQMAGPGAEGPRPVAALVTLLRRCNRSVPHMEVRQAWHHTDSYPPPQVVSTTLDILLNLARVPETRPAVAEAPKLLTDILEVMVVFRDNSKDIFPKCCAVLQILSEVPEVRTVMNGFSRKGF